MPRVKHIYGKKLLYVPAWPYWNMDPSVIGIAENFDRKMNLWKQYTSIKGHCYIIKGEHYTLDYGILMHDFQVDHTTQFWFGDVKLNEMNYKPKDVTLRELIKTGR